MKGDTINLVQHFKHQSQDLCPPKKRTHVNTEISLETLEILLTSVPEEEIIITSEFTLDTESENSTRNNIDHVLAHKQHYLKRLKHLIKQKRGVEWLYRNISYFQTQFPWEVISLLENMAHQKSPEVISKALKPINELHAVDHTNNSYSETVIGTIEGLQILTTNIRRLIYNNIETPLQQLTPQLIDNCSVKELEDWNNWCSNIESHIRQIEELLNDGQNFFSIRNFKLIEQLPVSERSQSALKIIINKVTTNNISAK